MTVPRAPITIDITVIFMFHSFFFNSLAKGPRTYLSFSFLSILLWNQLGQQSPQFSKLSLFCWLLQGLVVWPRLSDPFISQNPRTSCCVTFSKTNSELCLYHLFVWSNFNDLQNSQWITFPTQSCLVLYSFCASLLHSLIMLFIVSSLSPRNLH